MYCLPMFEMLCGGKPRNTQNAWFIFCPGTALIILHGQLFSISDTPHNHSHNEINPLKSFVDHLGKCHVGLNGLYGEET